MENIARVIGIYNTADFNKMKLDIERSLVGTKRSFSEFARDAITEKWESELKLKQVGK